MEEEQSSEKEPRQGGLLLASAPDRLAENDQLGFAPYVRALARFLLSEATQGPLTISIEGEWGSGKSSFLKQLEKQLVTGAQKPITVWFNAWRHDKQEELWAAFAVEFLRQVADKLPWWARLRAYASLLWRRFKWKEGWIDVARFLVVSVAIVVAFVWGFRHGWEWIEKTQAPVLGKIGLSLGGFAAAIEVLKKLKDRIGNPLSIDLKKYLKAPDYEQKASFLEQFHKDFSKIVKAYAGGRRVFVIIDDLDRCEIPKAAELMQALNLMISGEGEERLFFLLGMDRHKVAAGIAAKNEKLLPYLRQGERSDVARNADADWYGLKFGYEFIEKLIQIPVVIPRPSSSEIAQYVDSLSPGGAASIQRELRDTELDKRYAAAGGTAEEEGEPLPPAVEQRREQFRLKSDGDSLQFKSVVLRVAPALDYNPRRVKLFVNLFRLRLLTAVETGLLDEGGTLTLEKLGAFVALGLRWPLLLEDVAQNQITLKMAVEGIGLPERWTREPDALWLLQTADTRLSRAEVADLLRTLPSLRDPFAERQGQVVESPTVYGEVEFDVWLSGDHEEVPEVVDRLRRAKISLIHESPGTLKPDSPRKARVFAICGGKGSDAERSVAKSLGMAVIVVLLSGEFRTFGDRTFAMPTDFDRLVEFIRQQRSRSEAPSWDNHPK